jgi:transcriptional regulator with XRE-family HTH domain
MFTLADRLRKAREVTGLDQAQFAELANMSRTTVVNYEHGHRTPRRIYILAWAAASGVDAHWIETGVEIHTRELAMSA